MSESKIHNPEPAILDDRPSKQRDEAVENLRKCALPHIGSEYFRNSESKLGSVSSKTNEQKPILRSQISTNTCRKIVANSHVQRFCQVRKSFKC